MSDYKCSLLLATNNHPWLITPLRLFVGNEFEILAADSSDAAQALLANRHVDVVLAQWMSLRPLDGVSFLEWVRLFHPRTIRLLMSASIWGLSQECINRAQAFRYITIPWRWEAFLEPLRMAARIFILERRRQELLDEIMTLRSPRDPGSGATLTIDQFLSMTSLTSDQMSSIITWQSVQQANLESAEPTDGGQPDVPHIVEV